MCLRCKGWSDESIAALLVEQVDRDGFTTFGVTGDDVVPSWTYTIGLSAIGHPELVVTTMAVDLAADLLADLATRVLDDDRLDTVDTVDIDLPTRAHVRDVHPVHIERGLVDFASLFHRANDPAASAPVPVRQIVVPDEAFCPCHAGSQPPLHREHVTFRGRRPNRAERRRTARRRWHSNRAPR